jgi:hypothetical protein
VLSVFDVGAPASPLARETPPAPDTPPPRDAPVEETEAPPGRVPPFPSAEAHACADAEVWAGSRKGKIAQTNAHAIVVVRRGRKIMRAMSRYCIVGPREMLKYLDLEVRNS